LFDLKSVLHIRKPVVQHLHGPLVRKVHAVPRVFPRFIELDQLAGFPLPFSVQLPVFS
jgi:hypothetical protein